MDHERFDVLTKRFSRGGSRREVLDNLARGALALAAARFGLGSGSAEARQCRDYGCSCNGGEYRSCRGDLICCPYSFGLPGGLGQCLTEDDCYGPQCINSGDSCAPYCGWGSSCGDCCSGYCGDYGVCDIPRCTGAGCACDTGTYLPCDFGLSCCPLQTGIYGGPGICAPDNSC